MNRYRDKTSAYKLLSSHKLPWLVLAFLVAVLLLLSTFSYWQSSGVGPQVQVPMFYDAHYLFPRPWTQAQSAPGVPDPAPIGLYGPNAVSQSFIAGSDNLAGISFSLSGPEAGLVKGELSDERGRSWKADLSLAPRFTGDEFSITIPPQRDSKGERYSLTLTSPQATADQPVIVNSVGGDRLGGSFRLNEFIRPGNLAITTYSKGVPGRWLFDSISEQLLPAVFRLRIQQYKAELFKGGLFTWLLLLTVGLSALLLVLASPDQLQRERPFSRDLLRSLGWFLVILLGSFLLWQIGSNRVTLISGLNNAAGAPLTAYEPESINTGQRAMVDLINDLWTAERAPEARFISTEIVQSYPAIKVPADSRIQYSLFIPPDGRLRVASAAEGDGAIKFMVLANDEPLFEAEETAVGDSVQDLLWQELDLSPWAGQGIVLSLETSSRDDEVYGLWIMPQVLTDASWVLPDPPSDLEVLPSGVRFGDTAELLGVIVDDEKSTVDELAVQLLWRPLKATDQYGKIFVHLIDGNGQLVAQHDGSPVYGAYPIAAWQPGTTVMDEHVLQLDQTLSSGPYHLAIGIYDPETLDRWMAASADGTSLDNGSAILNLSPEVLP